MPIRLRDTTDSDLKPLGSPKNKQLLKYNATTDEFDLISADQILSVSVSDDDLPDDFIDQIEVEVDPNKMFFYDLNAGTF